MGFRDIETFNQAMLAKQLWWIITRPHTLVARVLKENYFKDTDIMEASTKGSPSYMWRSIIAAKELIKQGTRWLVGNGDTIKIWEDKWLTSPSTFQIQSPITILSKEARVSDLFIEGELKWNASLINQIFWFEETEIITQIPISRSGREDKFYWGGTKKGLFSVRSAYHLANQLQYTAIGETSFGNEEDKMWK